MSVEAASLLARLCDLGVAVTAQGGRLYVRDTAGRLTDGARQVLRERKEEVVAFLGRTRFTREELDALGFAGTPCDDGSGWEVRA